MKWLYRFFVFLGIVFFLLLVALGYFVVADPYNLRPIFLSMYKENIPTERMNETIDKVPKSDGAVIPSAEGTVVNENQAKALQAVGIDPSAVPKKFTPEQVACFVQILGQARVDAIVAGATPNPAEFYQAKNCL